MFSEQVRKMTQVHWIMLFLVISIAWIFLYLLSYSYRNGVNTRFLFFKSDLNIIDNVSSKNISAENPFRNLPFSRPPRKKVSSILMFSFLSVLITRL